MAIIEGGSGADSLPGTEEDDELYGFAGNDSLDGGFGNDSLYGGLGDDLIRTGQGSDRAWGGSGNDTLRGGDLQHILYGGAGADMLLLAVDDAYWYTPDPVRHRNTGYGGDGDDLLQVWGHHDARLVGGDGVDTARMLFYSSAPGTMDVVLNGPDAGMTSSSGQRIAFESIERLEFYADFGDHAVYGGDLDDIIYVGAGNDVVAAGAGNDTVGYRPDTGHFLDGGAGEDHLVLEGLSGQSVYFVVDGTGEVDDGMLSTILNFETYHVFGQGRADDIIALGAGNDSGEGFAGNDSLYGGGGRDTLAGGGGDDALGGGDGDDVLHGNSGNDMVAGDDGNDRLRGHGGNDLLYGGAGDDTLTGGAGADIFVFVAEDSGGDKIRDFESGTDQMRFAAALLGSAPGWTGPATADDIAAGAATAAHGQFVVRAATPNRTTLVWDPDGTAGSAAEVTLVTLSGAISLAAGDIWLF